MTKDALGSVKNTIASVALQTIALLLFNLFYFQLVANHTCSRWICWGFVHLAYALLLASAHSVKAAKNGHVYAYPKIWIATGFYLATMLVCILFAIFNLQSVFVTLICTGLLPGIHVGVYLAMMNTEAATIANEQRQAAHYHFIQECASRLELLLNDTDDFGVRKEIEKAFDAIRGSQVISTPSVIPLEAQIQSAIDDLPEAVKKGADETGKSIKALLALIRRRDAEIRMSK